MCQRTWEHDRLLTTVKTTQTHLLTIPVDAQDWTPIGRDRNTNESLVEIKEMMTDFQQQTKGILICDESAGDGSDNQFQKLEKQEA